MSKFLLWILPLVVLAGCNENKECECKCECESELAKLIQDEVYRKQSQQEEADAYSEKLRQEAEEIKADFLRRQEQGIIFDPFGLSKDTVNNNSSTTEEN